jgi:hypothetical protein
MKENKKTEVLQIRFTPEEKALLHSLAHRSEMTMAEYIHTLIGMKYVFRFSDDVERDEFLYV